MICRKCESIASICIRKEFWYCEDCFLTNTNHKFRSCLGKSKAISSNEKVLVCLSGGASSTVLLDLIYNGINLKGTKTLRIEPQFLHLVDKAIEEDDTSSAITDQCKKYNFNLHVVNMLKQTKCLLSEPIISNVANSETKKQIKLNTSPTINNDLITNLKRNIFINVAKELNCKFIFTAETTTLLAMRLLSNIALGRGTQVENDIGFADKRDADIKILRPMRDITKEEIEHYVRIKQLKPSSDNLINENSLQSVIHKFVLDLEENSPSTVSTVCKTADKIGSREIPTKGKKCILCQSYIEPNNPKLTAVDATIFSRQVSYSQADSKNNLEELKDYNVNEDPMFPSIYDTLCYSCSRNTSDVSR